MTVSVDTGAPLGEAQALGAYHDERVLSNAVIHLRVLSCMLAEVRLRMFRGERSGQ